MSINEGRVVREGDVLPPDQSSLSGLTVAQAKEFNRLFILSFLIFTGIALLAHIAAYTWRPWGKAQPSTPPVAVSQMYAPSAGASAPSYVPPAAPAQQ